MSGYSRFAPVALLASVLATSGACSRRAESIEREQARYAAYVRDSSIAMRARLAALPPCPARSSIDTHRWQEVARGPTHRSLLLPGEFQRDTSAQYIHGGRRWQSRGAIVEQAGGFFGVSQIPTRYASACRFPVGQ